MLIIVYTPQILLYYIDGDSTIYNWQLGWSRICDISEPYSWGAGTVREVQANELAVIIIFIATTLILWVKYKILERIYWW